MGRARRSSDWRGEYRARGLVVTSCAFLIRQAMGTAAAGSSGGIAAAREPVAARYSLGKPTTSSSDNISRLAFGSCNKQYLPQPMWRSVEDLSPDVWLWIGDAVYVDKHSDGGVEKVIYGDRGVDKMKEAFTEQLANEDYQRFLSKVPRVEGVWDDHDYGVNDAGKELSDHRGRVDTFLDFLGVGPEDPRRGGETLYASHVFGEAPRQVKVLLLDIRTQRDGYHAFNISSRQFKFAAMLGAMLRFVSSHFCLGSDYGGDVIGEDQWDWLEGQLTDSEASVHVLVSTLQVLTSNPLVESWGHFPQSRERLLSLLHRTNPSSLVILSGDVHHAELASGWQGYPPPPASTSTVPSEPESSLPPGHPSLKEGSRAGGCPFSKKSVVSDNDIFVDLEVEEPSLPTISNDHDSDHYDGWQQPAACAAHAATAEDGSGEGRGVVEVTTSGMTHSCLSSHGRKMCEAYLDRWRQHRWRDDAYYLDTNFGDIEIEWVEDDSAPQPAKMTVSVRDALGKPILPIVEHFGDAPHSSRGVGHNRSASSSAADARYEEEQQQKPERTFLDRSPPPECVEPVLPGGCTMRRFSELAVSMFALVIACIGLVRGARTLNPVRRRGRKTLPWRSVSTGVLGNGVPNGAVPNGIKNGARNGS